MSDVGYLAAFGGGIVSFVSPCVLPIVPGYLSMVTGLDVAEIRGGSARARILRDTGLFVLGFTVVFVALGLGSSAFGGALFDNKLTLTRISGLVILAMALFLVASMVARAPWLYREMRFHPSPSRFGPLAAPLTGAAFGFGWTPCIGPVLASVNAVAFDAPHPLHGASLLLAYSLGLGVPFVAMGLAFDRVSAATRVIRAHTTAITAVSASLMAGFGVLLVLNRLTWVTSEMQTVFNAIGLHRLLTLG